MTDKEVVDLLELSQNARNLEGFQWIPGMLGVYKPRSRGIDSHYKTRFREGMSVRNMSEWLVPDLLDASTAGAMFHQLLNLGAQATHGQHGDVTIGFGEDDTVYHGRFLGEACAKAVIARGSWA